MEPLNKKYLVIKTESTNLRVKGRVNNQLTKSSFVEFHIRKISIGIPQWRLTYPNQYSSIIKKS